MTFRTLSALTTLLLIGCGSDGATVTEFDEDTGGIQPADSSTEETVADTGAPPADATGDSSAPADTTAPPADTPADTPSSTTTMKCGAFTCTVGTQECCVLPGGVGACISKGAACAGSRWGCTSPSNCGAGEECCVSGAGGAGGGSCTASCPSTNVCDSDGDCSGSTKACCALQAGIKACTNKC